MEDLLRVPKYLMPFGFKKSQVSTNLNRAGAGAESGPLVWQKGLSMFSGFGKYCQSQCFELLSSQVFVIAFELPKEGGHHPLTQILGGRVREPHCQRLLLWRPD